MIEKWRFDIDLCVEGIVLLARNMSLFLAPSEESLFSVNSKKESGTCPMSVGKCQP